MKKWKIVCACVLAAMFLGFHFWPSRPEPGTGLSADRLCRTLLSKEENHEALSWVQESKPGDIRTIGEQSAAASFAIVKNLYDSGAVKAHVIGIEREVGYGETTNTVCVELPPLPSPRQKLFKIESDLATEEGFDPVPDEGQTYLFLYKFKLNFWQAMRSLIGRRS